MNLQMPEGGSYPLAEFDGLDWSTWAYRDNYCPMDVHSNDDSAEDMIAFITGSDYLGPDGKFTTDIGVLEKYLLTVGLFRRDIYASQFRKKDTLPPFIFSSSHDFEPTDIEISSLLERMCDALPSLVPDVETQIHDDVLSMMASGSSLIFTGEPLATSLTGSTSFIQPIATAEPLIVPPGYVSQFQPPNVTPTITTPPPSTLPTYQHPVQVATHALTSSSVITNPVVSGARSRISPETATALQGPNRDPPNPSTQRSVNTVSRNLEIPSARTAKRSLGDEHEPEGTSLAKVRHFKTCLV